MIIGDGYNLTDLEHKEKLLWWQEAGLQFTATGYGNRIPTPDMVRLPGSKRWRRVYCHISSNIGTCYVEVKPAPEFRPAGQRVWGGPDKDLSTKPDWIVIR